MLGYVERAWAADPAWANIPDQEKRRTAREIEWNKFVNAVGQNEIPRLEYLFGGSNIRLPKPGAIVKEGFVHANVELPGLTIRYTEDGSEPNESSKVYSMPFPLNGPVKLRAFSKSGRGGGTSEIR